VAARAVVSNSSRRHLIANVFSCETAAEYTPQKPHGRIEAHGPSARCAEAETVISLPVSYRHVSWWISRMLPKDFQPHHPRPHGAVTKPLLSRAAMNLGI